MFSTLPKERERRIFNSLLQYWVAHCIPIFRSDPMYLPPGGNREAALCSELWRARFKCSSVIPHEQIGLGLWKKRGPVLDRPLSVLQLVPELRFPCGPFVGNSMGLEGSLGEVLRLCNSTDVRGTRVSEIGGRHSWSKEVNVSGNSASRQKKDICLMIVMQI